MLQDDVEARDPVGCLAMDEVTDHNIGTPRVGAFGGVGPHVRQASKHRVHDSGGSFEDSDGFVEKQVGHEPMVDTLTAGRL